MNRCFILLMILFACRFTASAQDLTGIWRGHFVSGNESKLLDSLGIQDKYKFEVQIGQDDKAFQGITYSYKTTIFYGKASCIGTINKQTKKVLLQETKIVEVKSSTGGACIMTCFLQYSKVGNDEFMEGKYTGISISDSSFCGTGTVFLRKVPNSDFYKEPFLVEKEKKNGIAKAAPKKPATPATPSTAQKTPPAKLPAKPKAPTASLPKKSDELKPINEDSLKTIIGKINTDIPVPKVISSRKNEIVRTITTSAKEIYIKIYDNGTIDNDTVSVFVDNKLVLSKQRLTEKALTIKLNLDANADEHELVMVAENLGEIPPNTSLMVVTAGDQTYEVRITSTEQKNAVVLFKYDH
ncbi:MAG: hypothetical protein J7497_00985 [Chitinophagaceae bacterium]|nr:hypothetical protein [Chitinophagaceae bacterium]